MLFPTKKKDLTIGSIHKFPYNYDPGKEFILADGQKLLKSNYYPELYNYFPPYDVSPFATTYSGTYTTTWSGLGFHSGDYQSGGPNGMFNYDRSYGYPMQVTSKGNPAGYDYRTTDGGQYFLYSFEFLTPNMPGFICDLYGYTTEGKTVLLQKYNHTEQIYLGGPSFYGQGMRFTIDRPTQALCTGGRGDITNTPLHMYALRCTLQLLPAKTYATETQYFIIPNLNQDGASVPYKHGYYIGDHGRLKYRTSEKGPYASTL